MAVFLLCLTSKIQGICYWSPKLFLGEEMPAQLTEVRSSVMNACPACGRELHEEEVETRMGKFKFFVCPTGSHYFIKALAPTT